MKLMFEFCRFIASLLINGGPYTLHGMQTRSSDENTVRPSQQE